MATLTFYTNYTDGYLVDDSTIYATVHGATEGEVHDNVDETRIGQLLSASDYYIYRTFVFFDTSPIADDATIISATLTLYTYSKATVDTDFNIVVRSGMPTYPHEALEVGDFLYSHYEDNGGWINTADVSATLNAANVITLNATGLGWINKEGITKFALISSRDIGSILPDGAEYIWIGARTSVGGTSVVAKLIVNYATEETPAVTTLDPTYIKDINCSANGNITAGGVILEKGFEYGLTEEATWEVKTSIYSGEGTYSLSISGLIPETTYYIRAFATNSYGTAYGQWLSFTTTASSSYGMHEEDNAATICFYVRKVGGKWSIKHGPYTTDQADIEITKILVEGKGKYQIKFESDVLTGISAGVMCKVDIKAR